MNKNKWFLNGGRGSGRTLRLLCETYENKIADLEEKLANADYQLEGRDNEIKELKEQIEKMKCCSNCKYFYCPTASKIEKDGKVLFHNWNKEKQSYCDCGNGEGKKYQLWEIKEK